MSKFIQFGEEVEGFQVRVLNEREIRAAAGIMFLFAFLALLLGAVGVYGVTSYTVSQRVREIGIRVALGAGEGAVMRSTLSSGMIPVLAGLLPPAGEYWC